MCHSLVVAVLLLPTLVNGQTANRGRRPRAERLYAMGVALGSAGNIPGAQSYLRRAINADPSYEEPYVALVELFIMRSAWTDAQAVLQAGRRYHHESTRLARLTVELARRLGDAGRAARAARNLVRVAPDEPESHTLRAELARERGAWSEALTATRALLDLARRARTEPIAARQARITELEATERALRLVVSQTDPASRCTERPVRRALAGCEAPPP